MLLKFFTHALAGISTYKLKRSIRSVKSSLLISQSDRTIFTVIFDCISCNIHQDLS